jgi:subtilisin family serine protease
MAKKILGAGRGEHLPAGAGLRKGVGAVDVLRGERLTGRLLVKLDPLAELGSVLDGLKGFVFERLRVAVIEEGSAEEVKRRVGQKGNAFVLIEPERRLRKLAEGDDRDHGSGKSRRGTAPSGDSGLPFADTREAGWGIQAVNAIGSGYTGKGVKVAVLDTGFDFGHPDFAGRTIHRKSFAGRQAFDKDGHGTHCAGIVAGNCAMPKVGAAASAKVRKGKAGVRYGVAPGARLYIGKILDDSGEGSDGLALAGIEWALEKGCKVISMSFGAEAEEGYSMIFESVAQTVLKQGSILIGATGNESKRGRMAPVNHPANCPSVMAVGALTAALKVAEFSCGGGPFERSVGAAEGRGSVATGQVDLVAPGDQILSAKLGGGTMLDSGTSMAAPFVAGVAALLWEEYPEASAWEIWAKLVQRARRLGLPASAVGAGLVYAG